MNVINLEQERIKQMTNINRLLQSNMKPKKERVIVTGPDMIKIFWVAKLALEDRDSYEFVKKELDFKGDEAAQLYEAINNFLGKDKA